MEKAIKFCKKTFSKTKLVNLKAKKKKQPHKNAINQNNYYQMGKKEHDKIK